MELQLAVDLVTAERGLEIAKSIKDLIQVVEIGTPFAFTNPIGVIQRFKDALPGVKILADYKIMDGGEMMASLAFDANADIVTMSARTWDDTIKAAVATAKKYGRQTMADLMAVPDAELTARGKRMEEFGADYICVHRPIKVQGSASPEENLARLRKVVDKAKIAVTGGIDLDTLKKVVRYKPDLVIIGGSITGAADPRAVAEAMRAIMDA